MNAKNPPTNAGSANMRILAAAGMTDGITDSGAATTSRGASTCAAAAAVPAMFTPLATADPAMIHTTPLRG